MIRETQGYPDFRVFADDPGILGLDDAAYAYMRKSLERIRVQLEEQPDPKWSCRARQILFRILAVLAQGREQEDCAAGTEETAGRVCRYILTHLGEDLSVGSLCRTFATNHTSLYRQFKAHTGLPVSEYVLSKRLEAAKKQPGVHLPLSGGDRKGMRVPGERLSGARVQAACGDNPAFLPHRHAEKADGIGWQSRLPGQQYRQERPGISSTKYRGVETKARLVKRQNRKRSVSR